MMRKHVFPFLFFFLFSLYTSICASFYSLVQGAYFFSGATAGLVSALVLMNRLSQENKNTRSIVSVAQLGTFRMSKYATWLQQLEEQTASLREVVSYLMKKIDSVLVPTVSRLDEQLIQLNRRIGSLDLVEITRSFQGTTIEGQLQLFQQELERLASEVETLKAEIFESEVETGKQIRSTSDKVAEVAS